jgi:hypothetical protein
MAMTEHNCREIENLLVDYSDAELDAGLAARVESHLESCAECAARLCRLEESLVLARGIWTESAETAESIEAGVTARSSSVVRGRVIQLVVSSAAAVLLALLAWQFLGKEVKPVAGNGDEKPGSATPGVLATNDQKPENQNAESTEQDLLAMIDRAERRARLQVSLELLEETPSLRSYAEEAEQYLAAAYGDLDAGDPLGTKNPPGT